MTERGKRLFFLHFLSGSLSLPIPVPVPAPLSLSLKRGEEIRPTTGWLRSMLLAPARDCLPDRRHLQGMGDPGGSPGKAPHRSRTSTRLAGLAGALVLLGLLAPSAQPTFYGSHRRDAAPLARHRRRLVRPHSATMPPAGLAATASAGANSFTDRAGCCGTVSPACPGPYSHLLVYVAVPNAWADADAAWIRCLLAIPPITLPSRRTGCPRRPHRGRPAWAWTAGRPSPTSSGLRPPRLRHPSLACWRGRRG